MDLQRQRADLELRLRANGAVRGRLEEIGGLRWLLSAVAAQRRSASIEVRDPTFIVELDVKNGEVVGATRTTADGDFARGTPVVDAALAADSGEFLVGDSSPLEQPREAITTPDGRTFARVANIAVAAVVLAIGTVASVLAILGRGAGPSQDEARTGAELPAITFWNVIEGRVTSAFEPYLADRFPLRGPLLDVDATLRRARGFAPREDDVVVYSVSPEAVDLGADPDIDLDVAAQAPAETPVMEDEPEEPVEVQRPSGGRTRMLTAGILIRDGRAMQSFGGEATGAPAYAELLSDIHAAIGARATLYSMIVPSAQEFYLPAGSRAREERPNIVGTYARMAEGIRTVDAHRELARHTDENIYFRTDHHWTGLGAYYGYRAFCRAAGLTPVERETMERRVITRRWHGSLYRITRDPDLRPDEVEIAIPPTEVDVRVGRDERAVPLVRDAGGYEVFLGGDYPIMRVHTGNTNGRRAILIKNSFGNAFAVYLVSHYEELIFVDYRYYRGTLSELLDESQLPTDVIVMNGTLTANSRLHTSLIRRLLE